MKVTPVSAQDVASLPPTQDEEIDHLFLFKNLVIEGCLLNCEMLRTWQTISSSPYKKSRPVTKSFKRSHSFHSEDDHEASQLIYGKPFKLSDLESSHRNGCEGCCFLSCLLKAFLSTRLDLKGEEVIFQLRHACLILEVKSGLCGSSFQMRFFSPSNVKKRLRGVDHANVLLGDTKSNASFDKARAWIRECESSHVSCGAGRKIPLPKRCLDVNPTNIIDPSWIRLAETDGMVDTYVSLSHCWGRGTKPMRTTTETLDDHLIGMSLSELPKTFEDAVIIARRLGIRYLWIDSLCIIQDSIKDWETESSKMADIYRNSFITISASSSPDSYHGCFSPEKIEDLCFSVEGKGFAFYIAARYVESDGRNFDPINFGKEMKVFTRAWIYQERLLSRRILYCNYRELQYECRQRPVSCECQSKSLPPHNMSDQYIDQLVPSAKRRYARIGSVLHGRPKDRVLQSQHWQKTIMNYTKLRLTNPTDKLPAISGCAQEIYRMTGDQYLAGLWRGSLAQGMVWYTRSREGLPRPELWRAPTWSWASVDTIHWISHMQTDHSRFKQAFQNSIEEVQCIPTGVDNTGGVKSGAYIRLRARLYPVYLRRICRTCVYQKVSSKHTRYLIDHALFHTTRDRGFNPCMPETVPIIPSAGARLYYFPDYKYDMREEFDILPKDDYLRPMCEHAPVFLLYLYDGQNGNQESISDYFLVLKKPKGPEEVFQRIALVNIVSDNWEEREAWFNGAFQTMAEEERILTLI